MQEIISNALIDLDPHGHESSGTCSAAYLKATEEAVQLPSQRKRKYQASTGSFGDQSARGGLEAERNQNLTPISVKIAALEALEALLTVVRSFFNYLNDRIIIIYVIMTIVLQVFDSTKSCGTIGFSFYIFQLPYFPSEIIYVTLRNESIITGYFTGWDWFRKVL